MSRVEVLYPACKVSVDGEEQVAEHIYIDMSVGLPVDLARIRGPIDTKTDAEVGVELGYSKKLVKVFTGRVRVIHRVGEWSTLECLGMGHRLAATRVNVAYIGESVGNIVKDLASRSDVKLREVGEGPVLHHYYAGENMSVYEHIEALASISGMVPWFDAEGRLVVTEPEKGEMHEVDYKAQVTGLRATSSFPPSGVVVYGEGAASYRGSGTEHWVSKRGVSASAGTGGRLTLTVNLPFIRTRDLAERAAKNLLHLYSIRRNVLSVGVVGAPELRAGHRVKLKNFPGSLKDKECFLFTVSHVFSRSRGFVSRFVCGVLG